MATMLARCTPVLGMLWHDSSSHGCWRCRALNRRLGGPLLGYLCRVQQLGCAALVVVRLWSLSMRNLLALVRGQLALGRVLLNMSDIEETGCPCRLDDDGGGR